MQALRLERRWRAPGDPRATLPLRDCAAVEHRLGRLAQARELLHEVRPLLHRYWTHYL
jgi:hypothetical protein